MYYFTSDLHFGYERILEQANRPFMNLVEMKDKIIENFNSVLTDDDVLMILGDCSCYGYNPKKEIKEIKGHKVLIVGNHDKEPLTHESFRKCFTDIKEHEIIKVNENDKLMQIYLNHYPMAEWDCMYKGVKHFYGHIHSSQQGAGFLMKAFPNAVNVGVDVNDFMPMTATQLFEKRKKEYEEDVKLFSPDFLSNAVHVIDDGKH